ncbi:MAG TPA: hypothetical protein VHY83_04265 [Solirubrobacteraceae bacterium]|jgi:hypothetical protein|nr:hypothetical protein [Solirubrobacteraceae bacterium]
MSISPFSARPAPSGGDRPGIGQGRARLALAIAAVGIAATLLAYAISPGVRHAVSHATHSVRHAVGNVLDHDAAKKAHHASAATPPARGTGGTPAPSGSGPSRTLRTPAQTSTQAAPAP